MSDILLLSNYKIILQHKPHVFFFVGSFSQIHVVGIIGVEKFILKLLMERRGERERYLRQ